MSRQVIKIHLNHKPTVREAMIRKILEEDPDPECPTCLIEHASLQEEVEMHQAITDIHAWLRSKMLLVLMEEK